MASRAKKFHKRAKSKNRVELGVGTSKFQHISGMSSFLMASGAPEILTILVWPFWFVPDVCYFVFVILRDSHDQSCLGCHTLSPSTTPTVTKVRRVRLSQHPSRKQGWALNGSFAWEVALPLVTQPFATCFGLWRGCYWAILSVSLGGPRWPQSKRSCGAVLPYHFIARSRGSVLRGRAGRAKR